MVTHLRNIDEALSRTDQIYYLHPARLVSRRLRVRTDTGLSSAEASRRAAQGGLNIIPRVKQPSSLFLMLERGRDVLVLLLIAAAAVSVAVGQYADALIITAALMLDFILSYVQLVRTKRTLNRLRKHIQRTATVLRDGAFKKLPAEQLVVGDIIEVRAGERIPADARLLSTHGLRVHEAALTGESDDVAKSPEIIRGRKPLGNRRNMLYLGTTALVGTGQAVVTATGTKTEFGKIAQLLKIEKSPRSPLALKLQQSGRVIAAAVIGLVILLTVMDVLLGNSIAVSLRTAITLIVSAIPEDLTVILTIALTVGTIRILRQRGVVRQLASAETLGAATVICTDKTGTLTRGEMTAEFFDFLQGSRVAPDQPPRDPVQVLALAGLALASDARRVGDQGQGYVGSATEQAALAFVEHSGMSQQRLNDQWRLREAISFDPTWKYSASLRDHPTRGTRTLFVSGAPEILLEHSSHALTRELTPRALTAKRRAVLLRKLNQRAAGGQRLLGVAVRHHIRKSQLTHDDIHGLTFLGVLTMKDPVREDVPAAIRETLQAGVAIKIVTGDYAVTARAVARDVGLTVTDDAMCSGASLQDMNDDELTDIVDDIVLFTRVTPIDKQRIIRALQRRGHVVAMTGDGVNDAVALKSADIGVAMGSGKDIAKDASDLILLDDNFATIVAAIREGRVLRDNVRKVIAFLLSTNAAEVAIFLASLVLRLPPPLLPAQILWINLVTDGTSDMALTLEPKEREVMTRPPEDPRAPIISRQLLYHIGLTSLIFTAVSMGLYWYLIRVQQLDLAYARTMIFTFLAITSLLSVWSFRSLTDSIIRRGLLKNRWILLSASFSFGLQLLAIYLPVLQRFFDTVSLGPRDWVLLLVLAGLTVALIDLRKMIIRRQAKRVPAAVAGTKGALTVRGA